MKELVLLDQAGVASCTRSIAWRPEDDGTVQAKGNAREKHVRGGEIGLEA